MLFRCFALRILCILAFIAAAYPAAALEISDDELFKEFERRLENDPDSNEIRLKRALEVVTRVVMNKLDNPPNGDPCAVYDAIKFPLFRNLEVIEAMFRNFKYAFRHGGIETQLNHPTLLDGCYAADTLAQVDPQILRNELKKYIQENWDKTPDGEKAMLAYFWMTRCGKGYEPALIDAKAINLDFAAVCQKVTKEKRAGFFKPGDDLAVGGLRLEIKSLVGGPRFKSLESNEKVAMARLYYGVGWLNYSAILEIFEWHFKPENTSYRNQHHWREFKFIIEELQKIDPEPKQEDLDALVEKLKTWKPPKQKGNPNL
jgi:hypothetical protein